MKLEEYLNNSIHAYVKAERYVNDGSPSGFTSNTTSEETSPRDGKPSFTVPLCEFKSGIEIKDIGASKINFPERTLPIHPDMLKCSFLKDLYNKINGELIVAPTASGRTLYDFNNHQFIKLAYLDYLGRIVRHMEFNKIQSAFEVTQQLIKAADSAKVNPKFSFLREDRGRIAYIPFEMFDFKSVDKMPAVCVSSGLYEYGVLLREFKPYPYVDEEENLIPFFALFSDEYDPITKGCAPGHEAFILQLFHNQSKGIEDFLLEDILYPLFHTYFDALIFSGIELEAHAQNMLLSLNKDFKIKRIVCRDLESAGRDIDLMNFLGIKYDTQIRDYKCNSRKPKEVGEKYDKYTITHSFMFDFKLGEYIVTPLLLTVKKYIPNLKITFIEKQLKAFNNQFISKLPRDFFPQDWCSYDSINYEKTGQKRKYDWHLNPKYR